MLVSLLHTFFSFFPDNPVTCHPIRRRRLLLLATVVRIGICVRCADVMVVGTRAPCLFVPAGKTELLASEGWRIYFTCNIVARRCSVYFAQLQPLRLSMSVFQAASIPHSLFICISCATQDSVQPVCTFQYIQIRRVILCREIMACPFYICVSVYAVRVRSHVLTTATTKTTDSLRSLLMNVWWESIN